MSKYDNFLVRDYLNLKTSETKMSNCCDMYHLHNLVKDPTRHENSNTPSCIYLILTDFPDSFIETQI